MEPLPTTPRESAGGKIGSQIAFLMFSIVGGTCLILAGMANSQPIRDWIRNAAWEQANWKKGIPLFCFNDHFLDSEDRLLHEELPSADFSRGGVYFLGASSVTWALKLWDLPLECRPLIRNFSMIGTNHADQYDLVRFLVEQKGLLEAGGEKTLMIFGVSYHSTCEPTTHRSVLKGSSPPQHYPHECQPEPPLSAPVGGGSSPPCPSGAWLASDDRGRQSASATPVFPAFCEVSRMATGTRSQLRPAEETQPTTASTSPTGVTSATNRSDAPAV